MSDENYDAVLRVLGTADRLGEKKIGWKWADGRPTISLQEHKEAKSLVKEAEERVDLSGLEHGAVVARVWMDDEEQVEDVQWNPSDS